MQFSNLNSAYIRINEGGNKIILTISLDNVNGDVMLNNSLLSMCHSSQTLLVEENSTLNISIINIVEVPEGYEVYPTTINLEGLNKDTLVVVELRPIQFSISYLNNETAHERFETHPMSPSYASSPASKQSPYCAYLCAG